MDVTLFPECIVRYSIDSKAIRLARGKAGLSMREFSRRCGWTDGYQRKIEDGGTISEETAKAILQVLREAKVVTKDVLQ